MNNINYISETENIQQKITQPHIYKITNLINNRFYYGVHCGSDTENYWGSGKLIGLAIEKYGLENFKKEILLIFDTMEEALEYEAIIVNEKMLNNPLCYNLRKGGLGGDTYSYQSSERKEEISFKRSVAIKLAWQNKSEKEKEELSYKISETNKLTWQNRSEEEKEVINHKISESKKLAYQNKSEEEKIASNKNRIEALRNRTIEQKIQTKEKYLLNYQNKSEEEKQIEFINRSIGNKGNNKDRILPKYKCPYDNYINQSHQISAYIRKNHPDKKQWMEYTKKERLSFKLEISSDNGQNSQD